MIIDFIWNLLKCTGELQDLVGPLSADFTIQFMKPVRCFRCLCVMTDQYDHHDICTSKFEAALSNGLGDVQVNIFFEMLPSNLYSPA